MRRLLLPLAALLAACPAEGGDDEPTPEPSFCATQGWTERPFLHDAAFGHRRRDVADHFTLPTTAGEFSFRDRWTGCETYLFVPDTLTVSPLDDTPLLAKTADITELIEKSPRNAHYFFVPARGRPEDAPAFVDAMTERIDEALQNAPDPDWWRPRLHVVTRHLDEGYGRLDNAIEEGGWGAGIDRFQRFQAFGNLADVTRYSNALNNAGAWPWEANLSYIAYEAQYYNVRSDMQDRLDATDWTTTTLFYDENIQQTGRSKAVVELPDAATMASFDTLLVDLRHICDPNEREHGNCDAWDAGNRLHLCSVDDPNDCGELVARWITTYHREGRWLVDATEALPRLREGGRRTFAYVGARGGHFTTVRLLFANTGKGAAPFALTELFTGGGWNEDYDSNHPPLTFEVPADATRVHLSVTVTGHGMSDAHNCAEFCDHHHIFTVGGAEFTASHPDMGDRHGCLNQIDQGTVPNQHGTWWYERSSWCPGKQVDPWVFDITEQVTPGQTAEIAYRTNWGEPAFGGNINLQTWVTFWR